jgi:hypothetical protein
MIWNTRLTRTLAIGALTMALGASIAAAQDTIDPTADPTFGGITLNSGFTPDPFIRTLTSGGSINASSVDPTCTGYIAAAPDYFVNVEDAMSHLRILFVADGDTTLVVQGPDGSFTCNDDGFNLNPIVDIVNPSTGDYNIWVGSYSVNEFLSGYLMISEQTGSSTGPIASPLLSSVLGAAGDVVEPQTDVMEGLNPDAFATFGSVDLAPGFTPDPNTVSLISGGANNAGLLNLGDACIGYVATNPDYSVNLTSAMAQLIISFTAEDGGDSTLVVRGPAGNFTCNDDTNGLNPEVTIANATAGEYDIWVGSYAADISQTGTLAISEVGGGAGPNTVTGATSTPFVPTATPVPAQPAATATPSK